ncbi:MAG TPA: condensation domain-containing protein, partial [Longimicrobiaceae bacterium]
MSEVLDRLDQLSPGRQALLQKILRQKAVQASVPDPVRPRAGGGPAPLSFAQQRLWVIDRVGAASRAYHMSYALRLTGALDAAALERSLGEIVRRHDVLRTTFAEVDGRPVQTAAPFAGFTLPVEDLTALGGGEREAALKRSAAEEAARPFDLSAGPLFRARLLRLASEDHALLISMHHIVSDGWSMGVLFTELSALYRAVAAGGEARLAALPVQYADFAVWQREQLHDAALEPHLAWWRERLAGAPPVLELPADHPRPAAPTYRGGSVPVKVGAALAERLYALAQDEGATPFMVLLAAFQALLARWAATDDVVVGTPVAGRARPEVERLIGVFVNTLVLRTDLSGDPSFRQAVRRVREATLGAYDHQEVPFERLVAELAPERAPGLSPLVQAAFTLGNAGHSALELPGVQARAVEWEPEAVKFDLSLSLNGNAGGLAGVLTYGAELFERATVERMAGHLSRVLEQVAGDPDLRLSRLALMGKAERALVLDEWNRTAAEYPASATIHGLIEAQAATTPGAAA